jgi:hypothetical protein
MAGPPQSAYWRNARTAFGRGPAMTDWEGLIVRKSKPHLPSTVITGLDPVIHATAPV